MEYPSSNSSFNNYLTILDEVMFKKWLNKLKDASIFAFYLTTDSKNIFNANIVGIAFAILDEAAYLPVGHNYINAPDQLNIQSVLKQLKFLLEDDKKVKIAQNIKYNLSILKNYGIELNGVKFDTMLESYCLNSISNKHDIQSLAARWLNHETIVYQKENKKGNKTLPFNQININKASYYAAENANVILKLHFNIWPKLKQERGPKKVFEDIEIPLSRVISRIERNGVLVDQDLLVKYSKELATRLITLKQTAYKLVGESFNLSSSKQLQNILFNKQGVNPIKKTPNGAPSTSEEVLAVLALKYPLPQVILEYRSLLKLKSTYTDKLPLMINAVTGRLHTSYHQVITATGRLSSTDPNLQNIPIRRNEGRRIRQAFIAPFNKRIVSIDYSQIELRIMAHLSQDQSLMHTFNIGEDIHRVTASEIFNVEINKVSIDQRRSAKTINFGLIYGMSAFGLSRQLNISTDKAKTYIDFYFKRYPNVLRYMENIRMAAIEKGYVETLIGRRLWLPDIKSNNTIRRKSAERSAINAPLQGTAADIIKLAMISIDNWLLKHNENIVKMIMQVHDELVFEIQQEYVDKITKKICYLMENCIKLDVPLQVVVSIGQNWEKADESYYKHPM